VTPIPSRLGTRCCPGVPTTSNPSSEPEGFADALSRRRRLVRYTRQRSDGRILRLSSVCHENPVVQWHGNVEGYMVRSRGLRRICRRSRSLRGFTTLSRGPNMARARHFSHPHALSLMDSGSPALPTFNRGGPIRQEHRVGHYRSCECCSRVYAASRRPTLLCTVRGTIRERSVSTTDARD
jgi:hypothetical protein